MAMIYCTQCGKQVTDAAAACPYCGRSLRQEAPKQQSAPVKPGINPLGITGFVVTLANSFLSIFYVLLFRNVDAAAVVTLVVHIAALVFSLKGILKGKETHLGIGLAVAGLVLSILGILSQIGALVMPSAGYVPYY